MGSRSSSPWPLEMVSLERTITSTFWVTFLNSSSKVLEMVSVST